MVVTDGVGVCGRRRRFGGLGRRGRFSWGGRRGVRGQRWLWRRRHTSRSYGACSTMGCVWQAMSVGKNTTAEAANAMHTPIPGRETQLRVSSRGIGVEILCLGRASVDNFER